MRAGSDRDELDGAHGVPREDRAGHLGVGAQGLGDGDRPGLEGQFAGPVDEVAGCEEERGDRDVPRPRGGRGSGGHRAPYL